MDRHGMRPADVVKRVLLGRPLATARLEHERLGNPTALAVFASDNLSSCAYATEEILRVLVPVVGLAAFSLVVPISLAIVVVLAILLFSYRQTIKAYPSAGGAYIVTKDNFGILPAQVAAVSLLTDYVLTVAVSVSAGMQALSSAVPVLHAQRVPLAIGFIWLIAWGNLRGVRESGRLFAVPTYLFIVSMLGMLAFGAVRALGGDLQPSTVVHPTHQVSLGTGVVTVFLILKAFASGGAAVTGVEAISNGVPAFRKPEWVNARRTLMWMGSLLGIMFIGLSLLASHLRVVPVEDESKSVVAQIALAVFGDGPLAHAMFLGLQAATVMILILAANTSFADFPRLASFQAGDAFLPRQFTHRGHRLVFSSAIVALGAASTALVVAFNASVTQLIPLYAIGVFTSFTMSQAGMARRHLRLRESGWRSGLLINGVGAIVTAVVAVVIAVVKFGDGAWMIMVAVPLLVAVLLRLHRQYADEERELTEGLAGAEDAPPARLRVTVLIDACDSKTLHAVQYALTVAPRNLELLHLSTDPEETGRLVAAWEALGLPRSLRVEACPEGNLAGCLRSYAEEVVASAEALTLVMPGPARVGWLERIRRGRTGDDVREAVNGLAGVTVTVVRDHGGEGHPLVGADGRVRVSPRARHVVAVFVDRIDRSTVQALGYASALDPDGVRAYHVGVDPERAAALLDAWPRVASRSGIPLEAVHCPDRNVARTAIDIVARLEGPDTEVSVVLPRRTYARWWHRLLHDRTGRTLARALAGRPHVDVVTIPYRLGHAVVPAPSRGIDAGPEDRAALTGRRL
ncbi:MAG: amino acid permease [Actinomycetota bacterium]